MVSHLFPLYFPVSQLVANINAYLGDFGNAFGTKLLTGKDFNPITVDRIDFNDPNILGTYVAAKAVADKKI